VKYYYKYEIASRMGYLSSIIKLPPDKQRREGMGTPCHPAWASQRDNPLAPQQTGPGEGGPPQVSPSHTTRGLERGEPYFPILTHYKGHPFIQPNQPSQTVAWRGGPSLAPPTRGLGRGVSPS